MAGRELYFISGSPPCWSVMLALGVKDLDYTPRRLSNSAGDQKSPEYLEINPRGHVPVLLDGDTVVTETLAVLSYLDSAYPTPSLFGETPEETARIWQTISECDRHLRGPVGNISRPLFRSKAPEFEEQIISAAVQVRDELALLEARIADANWLAGGSVSAADLMVFPVLMQLTRATDKDEAAALNLAISPLETHYPAIAAWRSRMETLSGFDNAYPPHWKDQAA